jgi:hypothetical protein
MEVFGYLMAGAALLTGVVAQATLPVTSTAVAPTTKSPAPNSSPGNGWRYKGCYSYAFRIALLVTPAQ